MTMKALIPVRSGSVRVRNKNIRPFAGSTLLEIKIKQLLRLPELDGVIVNTNSDEMLEIAKAAGAETVKRDEYFASSSVSMNEVYHDMAAHVDSDIVLFADATNPLVEDRTIQACIAKYHEVCDEYDSLNSSHYIKEFMWLNGSPINYSTDKIPRSQDLPGIMALNFAVNILKTADMYDRSCIIGRQPYLMPISDIEATDIDNEIDFEFAEFVYKRQMKIL